jgi:hypothetical protein
MVAAAPWQGEKGHYFLVILRLSLTDDSCGHLNLKWVLDGIVSAFNRVPICETYFGLQEAQLKYEYSLFCRKGSFWVLLLEKTKK